MGLTPELAEPSVIAAKDQLQAAQARLDVARQRPLWRSWRERLEADDALRELRQRILRAL